MEDVVGKAKNQAIAIADKVDSMLPQIPQGFKQKISKLDFFTKVPISARDKRSSTGLRLFFFYIL